MATVTAERAWTGGRPLREAYGDLVWRKPALLRREMVLEAGSETLASLFWDKWYSFDARHNRRRIGRIVIARCRDAGDVPMIHTFGHHVLTTFRVTAEQLAEQRLHSAA